MFFGAIIGSAKIAKIKYLQNIPVIQYAYRTYQGHLRKVFKKHSAKTGQPMPLYGL